MTDRRAVTPRRLATLALMAFATPALADTLSGSVTHVRDGDTILVGDQPVWLNGVATPERYKLGGNEARTYMRKLVLGKEVTCQHENEGNGDRLIGICHLADADIGLMIVRAGLARDCPRFSGFRYVGAELAARDNGLDLSLTYALPRYCKVK